MDRQQSIMQSLSSATTAATTAWKPSMSELHVVKQNTTKRGPTMEDIYLGHQGQSNCKSCYCCEAKPPHLMKDCPTKDAECYKCRKNGNFKSSFKSKNGEKNMGKLKDIGKSKLANVHELIPQAAMGPHIQQQYAAHITLTKTIVLPTSCISEIPQAAFQYIQTVQLNNQNRWEEKRHIW